MIEIPFFFHGKQLGAIDADVVPRIGETLEFIMPDNTRLKYQVADVVHLTAMATTSIGNQVGRTHVALHVVVA